MQTYTEVSSSLECSDCSCRFNSASSLLQHFAQHVSQEASASPQFADILLSEDATLHPQKKKKKTQTILEKVLKRNSALRHLTDNCNPGPSMVDENSSTISIMGGLSSLLSVSQTKDPEHFADSDVCNLAPYSSLPADVILAEIGQRAKEKNSQDSDPTLSISPSPPIEISLVKCDFQKRLENCITRLATRHENGMTINGDTVTIHLKTKNHLNLMRNGQESQMLKDTSAIKIEDKSNEEEFNSLKYCFMSFEESEDNREVAKEFIPKPVRGASGRKQKTPKKLHYQQNGKINHTVEDPVSEVSVPTVPGNVDKVVSSTTTKRKYPCHLCSKVFGWSTDLKRHILTHTGERPFKCNICDATFTRNFLLQKHQSKIHSSSSKLSTTSDAESECSDVKCSATDLVQCSEEKLLTSGEEKARIPLSDVLRISKLQHNKWRSLSPLKKKKKLQCNKISSYQIYSHEALNIL